MLTKRRDIDAVPHQRRRDIEVCWLEALRKRTRSEREYNERRPHLNMPYHAGEWVSEVQEQHTPGQ